MFKELSKRKYILILLNCLLLSSAVLGQNVVKGFVFEDKNNNGKKDQAEKGMAGIAVSNGKDIVLTAKNGGYSLTTDSGRTIFVIKPANYKFPLNEYNNYKFYLKPDLLSKKPSAPVNFALISAPESDNFTSLVFGDPQVGTPDQVSFFDRSIVSEVEGVKNVSFGISMGDIVDEKFDMYEPYLKSIKKIGIPWHNIIGNHDLDFTKKSDATAKALFRQNIGPTDYSFNYGKAHFIILDDILYPDPRKGKLWGGFRPDQREFLTNDLKLIDKNQLIVVAYHMPLDAAEAIRPSDKQFIFDLLKEYPNVLLLAAHYHQQIQVFHNKSDGWQGEKPLHEYIVGTTCGSWFSGFLDARGIPVSTMVDGTPKGYVYLNVSGNKYTLDYKVAEKPKEYQMEITHPKVVMQKRHTPAYIVVNFFMGAADSKVQCRIDSGRWSTMTRTDMYDPNYVDMLYRWNSSEETKLNRWPSDAAISSHIWKIYIPNNYPLGTHLIEVKATDMFGRDYIQKSTYRIDPPQKVYP